MILFLLPQFPLGTILDEPNKAGMARRTMVVRIPLQSAKDKRFFTLCEK